MNEKNAHTHTSTEWKRSDREPFVQHINLLYMYKLFGCGFSRCCFNSCMPIAVAVCQQTSRLNSNVNKSIARIETIERVCGHTIYLFFSLDLYTHCLAHSHFCDSFCCCCGCILLLLLHLPLDAVEFVLLFCFCYYCWRWCRTVCDAPAWIKLTNWYCHCLCHSLAI